MSTAVPSGMASVEKDSVCGGGVGAWLPINLLVGPQTEPKVIFVLTGNLLTCSSITGQSC